MHGRQWGRGEGGRRGALAGERAKFRKEVCDYPFIVSVVMGKELK